MPHLAIDPILAVSNFVVEVQTLVSRNLNPRDGDVLTFGMIEGGTVPTTVAESAKVTGALRISNPDTLGFARRRIGEIAKGVGISSGCKVNYEFVEPGDGSYVVVMNDEKLTIGSLIS
jgi:metal-dependent amidase/aminoacylase/carboxypeptidase family protein